MKPGLRTALACVALGSVLAGLCALPVALLAKSNAVVGSIFKMRPPVWLNGNQITLARRNVKLHVGDVVRCGNRGDVTLMLFGYAVHPRCPSDYAVPNVVEQSDPANQLKRGAIVAAYKVKPTPDCSSASAAMPARGGGADLAQPPTHYTGVTCACPAYILNGQFCVANDSRAKIWYVRAWPSQESQSSGRQVLPPEQQVVHGQVYQFEVPTSGGRCFYDVAVEFEDGTAARWYRGNLCGTDPLTREWHVHGPSVRTGNP